MKILVADDDPISRRLIEACLTGAGYEVSVAVDGAEALELIGNPDSPRLLVLDRTMPHVDGVDVCRAIRKKALEPDVYIILVTGQRRAGGNRRRVRGRRRRLHDEALRRRGAEGARAHRARASSSGSWS